MGDIKWIKITTDIFDDEKILLIESLPEADSIIVIWFKLLCLAGKTNNSGVLMMNDKLAYTDKMLATIFRRKESIIKLALETFQNFGMIDIVDDVITIPNWGKHQNIEGMEKVREQTRLRVAKYRENQKKLQCNVTETLSNAIEKEEEQEKEREEIHTQKSLIKKSSKDYSDEFLKMYNELCPSLPKVRVINENRKTKIAKLFKKYDIATIRECLTKCEESDFLAGYTSDWRASIDWITEDKNFCKILNGNYDNHKATKSKSKSIESRYSSGMSKGKYDKERIVG